MKYLAVVLGLLCLSVSPVFASCEIGPESILAIQNIVAAECSGDVVCPSPCPVIPACNCNLENECPDVTVSADLAQCKRCREIEGKTRCHDCVIKFEENDN